MNGWNYGWTMDGCMDEWMKIVVMVDVVKFEGPGS